MPSNDAAYGAQFVPDATSDFAEQSQLIYLIPSDSHLDLETAFEDLEPGTSLLSVIPQRESLFFDETIDVLLILKTPRADEDTLRSHLKRLAISLEAQVVNSPVSGRDSPPASDVIFTGNVADIDDPIVIIDDEGSDDDDEVEQEEEEGEEAEEAEGKEKRKSAPSIYAAWKLPVFLTRPRIRLHGPSLVITASATLKPKLAMSSHTAGSGYLQSGMPLGYNLLQSFASDASFSQVKPRLSATRVSRVAPVTQQPHDLMLHVRASPKLELSIFPVVHTRIRFSRPNTSPSSAAVIALLEVDFTSNFDCEITLDKINLSIPDSTIDGLNEESGMKLPLSCVSHDHITFLYRIAPNELDFTPKNSARDLEISISATAHVIPGRCTPQLTMHWTTSLDFTTPVNPGFGSTTGTGIQRAHRPSQLSISGQAVHPLKSPSIIRPDALPSLEAATANTEVNLPELGITMTFTAPSEPIYPGDMFTWTVYVVNRASENNSMPPRKLALVAVPRRRRQEVRMTRPPSTGGRRHGEKEISDAVVDENILHAMQKNFAVEPAEVVCLSADTRVGPLAPGACHVVELQFLALQEGIVGMEAIRIVDLGSQEHVDIRDLPTMIVTPAAPAA
ncbi:TRAPP trafficking subunit Trs65-domain-containing protein [Mariannaea sp. PMI_226]|nr:TRAPP trafficking subunit Trs65-domain-containing protein [Mariannaea sp. PMI_226]